jgi:hypothetical protein
MIAGAMRMSLRENPDAVRELERTWPQQDWERYRTLARAKRRTSVGRLKNRLKQRMAAARMAIGYWSEEIPGFEVRLPPAMIRPSVDQLSKLIRSDIHIDDAHNIEKLVWRPSLPIIHLAMGTQLELCVRNPEARDNEIMTDDRDFVRSAVARASVFEPMVTHHPLLASGKIALTQVRWFE